MYEYVYSFVLYCVVLYYMINKEERLMPIRDLEDNADKSLPED